MLRRVLLIALLLALTGGLAHAGRPVRRANIPPDHPPATQTPTSFQAISTDDYIVQTDLPEDQLGPVMHRLSAMVREYRTRTADLSGQSDDRRLPFFLYSSLDDYTKAGGKTGSSGFFDGERLLAFVGPKADARSWHVIQHEAFHQYLMAKLGYDIPIWLNEGLAEYFSESIFTGDGFVTGVIPQFRMERVRESIRAGRFVPLQELLVMPHEKWNDSLSTENYDQAWSLVHFLAHADAGRYQPALTQYIQASARGTDPLRTFQTAIGNAREVEAAWRDYWLNLPDAQVRRGWALAAAQTINSYLARATAARQRVSSLDELQTLADTGRLQQPLVDQLPIEMLTACLKLAPALGTWQFDSSAKARANLILTLPTREQIQARYTLRAGHVQSAEAWYVEQGKAGKKPKVENRR